MRFASSAFPFEVGGVGFIGEPSVLCRTVVDATRLEFLSPFESLFIPLCGPGLLLPFSSVPFIPPLTESMLPLRDDLWSQLLTLNRPFGMAFRLVSLGISPNLPPFVPSMKDSGFSFRLPLMDVYEFVLAFPLRLSFSWECRT